MAVPTVPTVNSLLTEAFRRCGIATPTAAQLLRAEDEWFEEVKRDIGDEKRWHALEETIVMIPQAYIQVYPIPSPLLRVLRVRFYYGDVTGTTSAAGANSITLGSNAGDVVGRKIYITSGTGAAQVNRITAYDATTGIATVACAWTTTPFPSTFMVATLELPVCGPEPSVPMLGIGASQVINHWAEFEAKLYFWPNLSISTCALELDGVVDLSLVDETDARVTRVLREWRTALVLGVMTRIQQEQNDDALNATQVLYDKALLRLKIKDSRQRRGLRTVAMRPGGGMPRWRW